MINVLVEKAKNQYCTNKIKKHNSKRHWKTINEILKNLRVNINP